MPFAGDAAAAALALRSLAAIDLEPGDELLAVDNSSKQTLAAIAPRGAFVRVIPATAERSSYYARNVGALAAANNWLLFLDSDCVPVSDILDRFFEVPIETDAGAIAGEVAADPGQRSLFARYHADRGHLDQRRNLEAASRPFAVTANLLVRVAAWRSVGGFLEGVRSGGDTELSWRLQDAGWRLGYRPRARAVHRHRESLRSFGRVSLRYAAGRAWLRRRYPRATESEGSFLSAGRALLAALRWALTGDFERAEFRAVDALVIVLGRVGTMLANRSPRPPRRDPPAQVLVLTDTFPELSETFIGAELTALERHGELCRVEADRRARRQDLVAARVHRVSYREDDTPPIKLAALAWLVTRHPVRCSRDWRARPRWRGDTEVTPLRVIAPVAWRLHRGGEHHLHVHFAAGAALTAMRVSALLKRPYSVTAHAYDIFQRPRHLGEKLTRAAFVTTGCQYNVERLKELVPEVNVHEVVMGVDAEQLRRRRPYPGRRKVLAVGRLVEKKGFRHLIDAVARLEPISPVEALEIVGDGPLRAALTAQVRDLGLEKKVIFRGALHHDGVREAMESADVLVMPCVVAADGDRDSMPVVVKEALALELPVVASDEVGLPELIRPAWGRLVAPGDPVGLAAAIAAILGMEVHARVAMGRAGRRHVTDHCDVHQEAAKLARLIAQSTSIR